MSKDQAEKKKRASLLHDLHSGDAKKVKSAIKSLKIHGDESVLKPLVQLLQKGQFESEIHSFLADVNVSSAADAFIEIIRDEELLTARQLVLNAMWNTKIDFSPYLADFVAVATEGNFMESLECLTIMEQLEGPFAETQILESQLYLKEYMEDKTPKEEQKAKIISEIALLLKEFDRNIEA